MNPQTKTCQNCHSQFVVESEDFAFYEKIKVPPPTFCPECRMQRRMTVRNENTLYKDECDLCKKQVISMYSPDKPCPVYCHDCWNSDKWDPLDYGRDYNWQKPFFAQFRELLEKVPRMNLAFYNTNLNSDYGNFVSNDKNVYLSFSIVDCENVYYSRLIDKSREVIDSYFAESCEKIYENVDAHRNYRAKFTYRSRECLDSLFLFDCVNCQNCFMSSNLRNKQYVFRNEQLTKEAYKTEINKVNLGSHSNLHALKEEFRKLIKNSLHKFADTYKTTDCTGDNIENAKNTKDSFEAYGGVENVRFTKRVIGIKDAYDITGCGRGELMYEIAVGGFGNYNFKLSQYGNTTKNSEYTDWCHRSSNMFGCVGARDKKFCIFNKQYDEKTFNDLRAKITKHMDESPYVDKKGRIYKYGEFFPVELGLFGYNETIANEYFPLSKENAIAAGYPWRDPDPYLHKPTLKANDIPDNIQEVTDSILNEVIGCESCVRVFRILKAELEFFKSQNIALPRNCPDCRYAERFSMKNPIKLWDRRCMCGATNDLQPTTNNRYQNTVTHFHGDSSCPNEFETSYAPERAELVYCESCYQSEVI